MTALAIIGLGTAPGAAASPSQDFFGISAPELYSMSLDGRFALRDAALTEIQAAGIDDVRTEIGWRDVEPVAPAGGAHIYSWDAIYGHIAALAEHGQRLAPMLTAPPAWAQPSGSAASCGRRGGLDPSHIDDYAGFAAAVAETFGRGGTYWTWAAAHRPEMPQKPITSYEIFNEPNWDWFWCPEIDPETYAKALGKAADAIHAVDPQATVSLGGLVVLEQNQYNGAHLSGMATRTFLQRATAAVPNLASRIDAVAVHTYWATPADDLRALSLVENWLDDAGLGDESLVVSEYGWRSGGPAGALTEAIRAQMIGEYSDSLARTNCNVIGIYPHSWITARVDPADPEDWYGLADPLTGAPLASGAAYANVIASYEHGTGSSQPTLDVCEADLPPPGAATLTATPAELSASPTARFEYSATAAASFRCRFDRGGSQPCPATGTELANLAEGAHRFTVEAINGRGVAGPAASFEWTVDVSGPQVSLTRRSKPGARPVRFSVTARDPATVTSIAYRLDRGRWLSTTGTVKIRRSRRARHVLEARAFDRAGNRGVSPRLTWRGVPRRS